LPIESGQINAPYIIIFSEQKIFFTSDSNEKMIESKMLNFEEIFRIIPFFYVSP